MPTESHGVTPYERWFERKPKLSHMHVFGCIAFVLKSLEEQKKMEAKAEKMRFVGYDSNSHGYRFWDHKKRCIVIR